MTKVKLTARWLDAPQEPGDYSDTLVPSLKVRVAKSGFKTFSVVTWRSGRAARQTFCRFPEIMLAEARRRADAFSNGNDTGADPQEDGAPQVRWDLGSDMPITALLEDYVERMRVRKMEAWRTFYNKQRTHGVRGHKQGPHRAGETRRRI